GAMRVNISRTLREASLSVAAPSGRVPLLGAAGSVMEKALFFDKPRSKMENALERFGGNVAIGTGATDARAKDEAQLSSARFFVRAHRLDHLRGPHAGPRGQSTEPPNQSDDPRSIARGRDTGLVAEQCRGHHSPGHSFAMLETAVVRQAFKRMAKRMAEIQNFAEAGLLFVLAYDLRLDLRGTGDEIGQNPGIASEGTGQIFFEEGKHFGVCDDAIFDDLGQAAAKLAVGQRAQERGVR